MLPRTSGRVVAVSSFVYAVAYALRSSFELEGRRWFLLCDDAMVSMRYARNLVDGNGLVANAGEKVEGMTNLGWTLLMAGWHLVLPGPHLVSLGVQLTSAALLAAIAWLVVDVTRTLTNGAEIPSISAGLLAATYLPLVHWSVMGLEVGAVALALLVVVRALVVDRFGIAFTLACLLLPVLRPDGLVPAALLLGARAWLVPGDRRAVALRGVLPLVLAVAAVTTFRLAYFGDLTPLTYHLKMTGYPAPDRIGWGFARALEWVSSAGPLVTVAPLVLAWIVGAGKVRWAVGGVVAQLAWNVWVGGDAWEWWWHGANRYVATAAPLLAVTLGVSLGIVGNLLADRTRTPALAALAVAAAWQLDAFHDTESLKSALLLREPFETERTGTLNNAHMAKTARVVADVTTPEATVTVAWAGIVPYVSERYGIDVLGKTDPVIAKKEMRNFPGQAQEGFWPGHLKSDLAWSVGDKRPDVLLQAWPNMSEAKPWLGNYARVEVDGIVLRVKKGSPHVRWDKLPPPTPAPGANPP